MSNTDGTQYESVRIIEGVHKLRFGSGARLVEAKGEQSITFLLAPYPHFLVMPQGIEIPLHNVASAVPKTSAVAGKLRRTGQTGGRVVKPVPSVREDADEA